LPVGFHAALPNEKLVQLEGGRVLLCHGSPGYTSEFLYEAELDDLRLKAWLDRYGVRGFVFGEMLDCLPPKGETYTLQQVILRVLAPYNVPIIYGLQSGHVTSGNITLPIGVQAELDAADSRVHLKIMETSTLKAAT
jgi:muramoyltetrapeptide carboxypeptidase LdcA involved in peptidoglycan recycling